MNHFSLQSLKEYRRGTRIVCEWGFEWRKQTDSREGLCEEVLVDAPKSPKLLYLPPTLEVNPQIRLRKSEVVAWKRIPLESLLIAVEASDTTAPGWRRTGDGEKATLAPCGGVESRRPRLRPIGRWHTIMRSIRQMGNRCRNLYRRSSGRSMSTQILPGLYGPRLWRQAPYRICLWIWSIVYDPFRYSCPLLMSS